MTPEDLDRNSIDYVESDVPLGLTLREWEARRARERREIQAAARQARRQALGLRLVRAIRQRPAVCAGCLLGIHCAHVALGIHGFEGLEAALLQIARDD